jgi:hypothetical protein
MGAAWSGNPLSREPAPGAEPSWIPCTPVTKRCQYWTWRKDYLRPECCTRHLRTLLAFTEDLLTRHGIFHFLDYGSLLGAVRSQTLIAWDEDADFSCLRSDLCRVLKLEAEIEAAGFWLDARQAPHVVRICRSRANQAHADLWFQQVRNGFSYTWSLLHRERYRFPIHYMDRLASVILEGTPHPAPMPVERFLADHRYGPDFMTPRRVAANFGWIPNDALTPEVQNALDQLREIEYRVERLQATRGGHGSAGRLPWRRWLERAGPVVPGLVLRAHRRLWMATHQLQGQTSPALREVRYELYRRRKALQLLESREPNRS